jgi:hypothetical protein
MIIASVDPGITGAIAILSYNEALESVYITDVFDMPTAKLFSKTVVDLEEVCRILRLYRISKVVVEQVGASPRMGTSSAFNFGAAFMGVIGVAAGTGLPVTTISPTKWKTYQGLLKKPKDAARLKVIKMFPERKKFFKFKKDVDKADAVLIGTTYLETSR